MALVRCNGCGATLDTTEMGKVLGRASGGASSGFNLFDLNTASRTLACIHCGSRDMVEIEQAEANESADWGDAFVPRAGENPFGESKRYSSVPPVAAGTKPAVIRDESGLNPNAVMLAIVGTLGLALFVGLVRTLGAGGSAATRPAQGGPYEVETPGVEVEPSFQVGDLQWQTEPARSLMRWEEAQTYCGNLGLLGAGWRLPSVDELKGLYHSKPLGTSEYPGMDWGWYWSSTPADDYQLDAWFMNFRYGDIGRGDVSGEYGVRCVR